ncbi:MAG: class I SAM-dependent methyltransferase [Bradymonadaceae bacterium]
MSGLLKRFSPRAAEYTRHRPEYPPALLDFLEEQGWIGIGTEVADVGAGTGIFTEQLIGKGCEVWAVEPNGAMLSMAQNRLQSRSQFHGVPADAEDIRMDDRTVDLVCVAQALHWFDLEAARSEFERILRKPERVALLWNIRDREASPFMAGFEDLIAEYGIDYEAVYERFDDYIGDLDNFFGDSYDHRTFDHPQTVGEQDLIGLVTSYSYMPRPNNENFDEMIESLRELFADHADGGTVDIQYDTELYYGLLSTPVS